MTIRLSKDRNKERVIEKAVDVLRTGGVLVVPTETAYGLAADATNGRAIRKIYKVKGRSFNKFLPLIAGSLEQMREFFELGKKELEMVKKHKGLTMVLKVKSQKPPPSFDANNPHSWKADQPKAEKLKKIYLLKGQKTCAVRISRYKLARELALELGRPITATSANVSGEENCYSVEEVVGQLGRTKFKRPLGRLVGDAPKGARNIGAVGKIDLIIDGGKLKKRKPSTIVRVQGGKVEVVRQGEIEINSKIKIQKSKLR